MIKLIYPQFWQTKNITAYLLLPFSAIYWLLGYIRFCFATPVKFPSKVISVGNINVGGSGKTQIVIWLANFFKLQNIKFVIITKGYGSSLKKSLLVKDTHKAEEVGDESLVLINHGTVIAAKKIHYAVDLINTINPEVIIVDDGMQNPNFYKDLTILTIDAARGYGNQFLIPAGPLRQSLASGVKCADIIISVDVVNDKKATVFQKPFFQAQITPVTELDKKKTYYAFSAIGHPERFLATLMNENIILSGYKFFPDHHNYSDIDLASLDSQAKELDSILITTRKDYIKINGKLSAICFDVSLVIHGQKELENLIYEKIFKKD
jgi:tetraacyldisaccharide 4'-kinase